MPFLKEISDDDLSFFGPQQAGYEVHPGGLAAAGRAVNEKGCTGIAARIRKRERTFVIWVSVLEIEGRQHEPYSMKGRNIRKSCHAQVPIQ